VIPLVIVRPEPGAAATQQAAQAMGLQAHSHPIFTIQSMPWTPVPRDQVDAVILGSVNALRHGGEGLAALRGLPAYCVGRTTGVAAKAAGFDVVRTGTGGLQHVLALLAPEHRRLLRLAGASRVPLSLPPGVTMETRVVYDAVAMPLSEALRRLLEQPAVVMLHSGEAASHFDALCLDAAVERARIQLAVIGPRVAHLVGSGWGAVETAGQPSDAALLALAAQMCQDPAEANPVAPERPDAGR
jgi:uroporphyrinogen-III synthase